MDRARTEQLVGLLARHQEPLYRFIFALLPHEEDARDVLQETCIALCRKFDEYEADRPFLNWAHGFAYREVLRHRKRTRRTSRLLSLEALELLVRERVECEDVLQAQLSALDDCLARLSAADRDLIRQRYQEQKRMEDLVEELGGSRRTLFRNLQRIRRLLFDCINHRWALDGGA